MTKKSKVYTRTGDKGLTSLVSGNRVLKSEERIDLYGEVDELNSYIGLAVSSNKLDTEVVELLEDIQSRLFDLGSNLACEYELREKYKLPQVEDEFISNLEKTIDDFDSCLEPLKNFILPGGDISASYLHVARTICRKVERKLIHFYVDDREKMPKNSLVFLNRLSDFLFVLARVQNKKLNVNELVWKPN